MANPNFCQGLEDVEVMIDALADPDKRWFAARELAAYIQYGRTYGVPEIPPRLLKRIGLVLGMPLDLGRHGLQEAVLKVLPWGSLSDPETVREIGALPGFDENEIRPAWTYRHCVFHRYAAAVAYKEYCDAKEAR